MVDRLSALDASFLRVETKQAHMHVGWLATVELPGPQEHLDVDAVRARIEGRLHLVPRFRQVVRAPVGALGSRGWADAPSFDLDRHVIVEGQRSPSRSELMHIAERFFSAQLPRDRPLWQLHVVPRLAGGDAAILGKVHHAMVDGIAAVGLGILLFDASRDQEGDEAVPWEPAPASRLRAVTETVRDGALDQFRAARGLATLGLSPGRSARVADSARRAALGLLEDVAQPAPTSYLNRPIGPRRRLVGTRLELSRVLGLKRQAGASLNDVVLAIAAGALHRLALACGQVPDDLRAMVPASVRRAGDERGNAISFLFVDVPVTAAPAGRLALISGRMGALKESGRIGGSDHLLRALELLPAPAQGPAARLAASPRLYNLTVSNVPGPRSPLYLAGGEVRSILPVIPIPDRHALALGALTYGSHLFMSGYFDPIALPEARGLPMFFQDAFQELRASHGPPIAARRSAA